MPENVVSLIKYKDSSSVRKAVKECDGLASLKAGATVLLKPNLVGWDNQGPYAPWGVLTTSKVMEGILESLKDAGAGRIIIGEASVKCRHIGSSTRKIYENLGYDVFVRRFGVELADFNEEEFDEVEIENGHRIRVASRLKECDFFVNAPVLKTHANTVVSLGMKNLKGLMHNESKCYFHAPANHLDHLITVLAERFPPSLTVIDGIFANERGPLHLGLAHRFDAIIASTDVYAADLLGAYLVGYGPDEVKTLSEWAGRKGRSRDLKDLDIRGDLDPDDTRRELAWDWEWLEDNTGPPAFGKKGLKGIRLPKYDHTLCTGCSYMFNPLMLTILSSDKVEFDDYEFLSGAIMEPSGKAGKTFLFGKCQVDKNKDNPHCRETVLIKGCPPTLDSIEKALNGAGMYVSRDNYDQYRQYMMSRYLKKPDVYPPDFYYMGPIPDEARPRK